MAHSQEVLDLLAKRQEVSIRLQAVEAEAIALKQEFNAALRKERLMDKIGKMSEDEKAALKAIL